MFQCENLTLHMYVVVIIKLYLLPSQPNLRLFGTDSQLLRLLIAHQRLKSLFELLNRHLLTIPMLHATVDGLRWDKHVAHDMDNTI